MESAEVLKRVSKKFLIRQDTSISRRYGGTGLGFGNSSAPGWLMGGSIAAESNENLGTKPWRKTPNENFGRNFGNWMKARSKSLKSCWLKYPFWWNEWCGWLRFYLGKNCVILFWTRIGNLFMGGIQFRDEFICWEFDLAVNWQSRCLSSLGFDVVQATPCLTTLFPPGRKKTLPKKIKLADDG